MSQIFRKLVGVAVVGALALSLGSCSDKNTAGHDAVAIGGQFQFHSPGGKTEIFYSEDEREPVGNVSGDDLVNPGKTINLDDYAGKVVVLNAWGQWCAPCRAEVDDLENVQTELEKSGQGTVLGINVRDHNRQIAQDFIKDNDVNYPSIYDPPFLAAASLGGIPASVIPTTIVLDKQHRPAAVFLRSITDKEILDVVRPLLEES
ncbi:redoxin domain-containing protein [Corynebacterium poyangense]|uniref:Redoxin domain-containing protein n=1 Tax=Corynebacterium poyangense TaxID=2684405 RepID=A0A7H0SLW1_9CORY|nr:TlpA disulfide reductase family protein [Corynebacterium poyangense]MBZ8177643.1 redoxin domain-containing protein [Corynebacterium poyangense]QNQ89536.1 redoxin domain-containing protein [Corynebacterium poyangense]